MKLKKGDNVIVATGKDRGKKGKIVRVVSEKNQIVVEGVNVKKHHQKSRSRDGKGQVLEIEAPINASNAMFVDPKSGKGVRLGKKLVGEKYVRVSKKTQDEV